MDNFRRIKPRSTKSSQSAPVATQPAHVVHVSRNGGVSVLDKLESALSAHGVRVRRYGRNWVRIPAVWRGSRDPNIAVCLSSGTANDFLHGGERIEFVDLMKLLGSDANNVILRKREHDEVNAERFDRIREATSLWNAGTNLTTDTQLPAACRKYLASRSIPEDIIRRVAPMLRVVKSKYSGLIMLSPIYQPRRNGDLIGVQRTFLTFEGNKNGQDARAMLGAHFDGDQDGAYSGGFLIPGDRDRFQENYVAIVEGLETGLAVQAATGMPVYVTYDGGGFSQVNLEYLVGIGAQGIIACIDDDDPDQYGVRAGLAAAQKLAARAHKEFPDLPVHMALPDRKLMNGLKCDWRDLFQRDPIGTSRSLLNAPVYMPPVPKPIVRPEIKSMFAGRR